jgi:hypothetical protein
MAPVSCRTEMIPAASYEKPPFKFSLEGGRKAPMRGASGNYFLLRDFFIFSAWHLPTQ